MVPAYLPVLLFVLVSLDSGFSEFEEPCCGSWLKEGWMGISKTPALTPEAVCVNGITRMKFTRNMVMKILYKPMNRTGVVGVSACKDDAQDDCYVAEIFGLELGRLGYWWRKHTPYENGDKGWVPGKQEKLEETKLQQESRVSQGTWDQEGQTTYRFYVERSPLGRLEIRLDGGDAEQQNEMAFPLADEYDAIAVASDGKVEVVGAAGCGNPKRIKFRAGQEMKLKWSPGEIENSLGVSFCSDIGQSECYVFDMFGESNRKLHFWWRKHSFKERGNKGWVPGKNGLSPEIIIKGNTGTAPNLLWPADRKHFTIILKRGTDGTLAVQVEGGDPSQNENLMFQMKPKYQYGAVEILHANKKGASISVLGPCFNGEQFGYLAETCETPVNLNGIAALPSGACSNPRRLRFRAGQDMKLKWSPGEIVNSLGVSFCSNSEQSECYVLDMFGESNRKMHFWWRRHSWKEKGNNGWVPGKGGRYPETILRGHTGTSPNLDWPADRRHFTILLKRASSGQLTVQLEGADPRQNEELTFELKPKYQHGAVEILYGGKNGASVRISGPCFNQETFGCLVDSCETSGSQNGISASSSGGLREVWSLRPGRSRSDMTSPPVEIPAGSERLCVSASAVASQGARITIDAVPVGADPSDGITVGELTDNGLNPPEWQQTRLVVDLPPYLRSGSINLVLSAEREPGSLLILQSVELCGTQDCGVATARGDAFIAYGKNASLAEFPWHAAIYRGEERKQICGGSLVRPDIVISAAHCVHDMNDILLDKSAFKVAVGKLYSDFNTQEPYQQISDVLAIHVPVRYGGSKRDFEHDLAVLQVVFVFTSVVVPICFDWTGRNLPPLKVGEAGLVAGWGLTENRVRSPVLLFGRLPYVPYAECTKAVPETFSRYITADKFCAGNINGTTVKPGDSGGGLAFLSSGRWYLRGVVSTGVPNELTYSTFVDLIQFKDWIKNLPAVVAERNSMVTT